MAEETGAAAGTLLDLGRAWPDMVFWAANLAAAPLWLAAIFFPIAERTKRVWGSEGVAVPFALAFTLAVLPRLQWWLELWLSGRLALSHLIEQFADRESFLLLWLYIIAFDVAIFASIYRQALANNTKPLEMSVWAAATAVCAPLAYAMFTMLTMLDRDTVEEVDEEPTTTPALRADQQPASASATEVGMVETDKTK